MLYLGVNEASFAGVDYMIVAKKYNISFSTPEMTSKECYTQPQLITASLASFLAPFLTSKS